MFLLTPLCGMGRTQRDQGFASLCSSHGHAVWGVSQPFVLQHCCTFYIVFTCIYRMLVGVKCTVKVSTAALFTCFLGPPLKEHQLVAYFVKDAKTHIVNSGISFHFNHFQFLKADSKNHRLYHYSDSQVPRQSIFVDICIYLELYMLFLKTCLLFFRPTIKRNRRFLPDSNYGKMPKCAKNVGKTHSFFISTLSPHKRSQNAIDYRVLNLPLVLPA